MHPRNPYVIPPDFAALGEKYPFLRPYVSLNSKGRGFIDFKNKNALWALTRVLLKEDFGLDVMVPEDALIPTLTLRLNYILWIEDLLKRGCYADDLTNSGVVDKPGTAGVEQQPEPGVVSNELETDDNMDDLLKKPNIADGLEESGGDANIHTSKLFLPFGSNPTRGLDIGTGPSAVFVLLGSKKNNWEMIGTDINSESIRVAKRNVEKNGLGMLARVQLTDGSSAFGCVLDQDESMLLDFTMCNPPFFSSEEEADSNKKSRRADRPPPSGAKTGLPTELAQEGGEVQLITTMLKESKKYATRVRIFSTMVGVKRHLDEILLLFKSPDMAAVEWYEATQFEQGRTMRWGLAWSFFKLEKPLKLFLSNVTKTTFGIEVPNPRASLNNMQNIHFTWYKIQLVKLGFKCLLNEEFEFEVICDTNTWSNQRRFRRAKRRLEKAKLETIASDSLTQGAGNEEDSQIETPNKEGELQKSYLTKNPRGPEPEADELIRLHGELQSKIQYCTLADYEGKEYGLRFLVSVLTTDEDDILFLFAFLGGSFGKEGMRQVREYIHKLSVTPPSPQSLPPV